MKNILIIFLLMLSTHSTISYAGEEPTEVYLFMAMNGERHKIQILRSTYPDYETCHREEKLMRQGNHTRANIWCATTLEIVKIPESNIMPSKTPWIKLAN